MDERKNTPPQPPRRRAAAQQKALENYEREQRMEALAAASQQDPFRPHDDLGKNNGSARGDGPVREQLGHERWDDVRYAPKPPVPKKKKRKKKKRKKNGCLPFLILLLLLIAVTLVLGWMVFPEEKDALLQKVEAFDIPARIKLVADPLLEKMRGETPAPVETTPEVPAWPENTEAGPTATPALWWGDETRGELPDITPTDAPVPTSAPMPVETDLPEIAPTDTPVPLETDMPDITPTDTPAPTNAPEPTPTPYRASTARAANDPSWLVKSTFVSQEGVRMSQANRDARISFGDPQEYAARSGVFTYRGGPLRQNAAYGTADIREERLVLLSDTLRATTLDGAHAGFGYGSQPAIVNWHANIREMMGLDGPLKEVIYASDDGRIYFLNLDTQEKTREPINVGLPVNAAVSVNPRGIPLLYVGQTASAAAGNEGVIGMRMYNLMDQTLAGFQSGVDAQAASSTGVISSSALLEKNSDTLIYTAENGMLYTISLNTVFTEDGTLTLQPEVIAYGYQATPLDRDGQTGIRASAAAYGSYVYFGDMSGVIQCVDLNTMQCVWAQVMGDSVVANVALECHEDGSVDLYAGSVVNLRGASGPVSLAKYNALTGELLWTCGTGIRGKYASAPAAQGIYAGAMAAPLIGEGDIDDLVIFSVNHVDELDTNSEFYAVVYALDKNTGEEVWRQPLYVDSVSSPIALYRADGKSYLVMGDESGTLRLMDGFTGSTIDEVELGSAIRSSPAAYNNQIVVGTTEGKICFVEVK